MNKEINRKTQKRVFKIKNFRNIGFQHEEKLLLNTSLDKNQLGELIILIGPNNSGKSNVLSSIQKFGTRNLTENDFTNFSFNKNDRKVELTLSIRDFIKNNSFDICYSSEDNNYEINFSLENHKKEISINEKLREEIERIKEINLEVVKKYFNGYQSSYDNITHQINCILNKLKEYKGNVNFVFTLTNLIYYKSNFSERDKKIIEKIFAEIFPLNFKFKEFSNNVQNDNNPLLAQKLLFEEEYGFNLIPKVYILKKEK